MIIHRDCYVRFEYRLRLDSGELIRGTEETPAELTFVAGYQELLPSLENHLLGLKDGDNAEFTVAAAEAFGNYDPKAIQEMSKKRFPDPAALRPGQAVTAGNTIEPMPYTYIIKEVLDDTVILDLNHPLAGQDLHYSVHILEVRAATPEEIEPLKKCESCKGDIECQG